MKILSSNIEYGGFYLYKKFKSFSYINEYIKLIKKYDIEVICFQEAFFEANTSTNKTVKFDITKIIAIKLK